MLEPHEFEDESSFEDDPDDADRGGFGGVDQVKNWSEMVDGFLGAGGGADDGVSTPLTEIN